MNETEIKLAYFDKERIIYRLKELGAVFKSNQEINDVYYSNKYNSLEEAKTFIRIRTKNKKSELTFKGEISSNDDIWKRIELNSGIENLDNVKKILELLGFKILLNNTTIREYWILNDVEIAIINILEPAKVDYLELECDNEDKIKEVRLKLGGLVSSVKEDHFKKLDEARKNEIDIG